MKKNIYDDDPKNLIPRMFVCDWVILRLESEARWKR